VKQIENRLAHCDDLLKQELSLYGGRVGGECTVGRYRSRYCGRSIAAIELAADNYGQLSRAAYLAKYNICAEVLSWWLFDSQGSEGDKPQEYLTRLLRSAVRSIKAQFEAMDIGVRKNVLMEKTMIGGRSVDVYRYSQEEYKRTMAKLGQLVVTSILEVVDAKSSGLRGGCSYLYVISPEGQLIVCSKPMFDLELVAGLSYRGVVVKHPMIAQWTNLAVVCAGDFRLVRSNSGDILGVFATRASGHYRPSIESSSVLRAVFRATFSLCNEGRVLVVGEEETISARAPK
jgi:hypothetical protein